MRATSRSSSATATLDDAIKSGDVEPAFVIFRRYQQRNRERMAYAIELLKQKPDFDVDESFNFDREKEPWPANAAEMNELWRKRVKNDGLSLVIAGKQWPEVSDMLRKRYEHVAKRMDQSKPEDVFEAFMNAFVLSLDPHSNYFSARNSEEYNIQMSLSYREAIGTSRRSGRRLRDGIDSMIRFGRSGRNHGMLPPTSGLPPSRGNNWRTAQPETKATWRRSTTRPRCPDGTGCVCSRCRERDIRRRRSTAVGEESTTTDRVCAWTTSGRAQGDARRQRNGRDVKVGIVRRALASGLRRRPEPTEGLP